LELGVKYKSLDGKKSGGYEGKRPAVISIGAGKNQLPLILVARKMGWSVIAVDRDPNAPGFRHADVCITSSTHDTNSVMAMLYQLNDDYSFEGVVARTSASKALRTAATVSEEFSLPGLTRDLLKVSTEKSTLREFCSLNGLPVPTGARVGPRLYTLEGLDSPVIVKPDVTCVGKANVRLCTERTSIAACAAEAAGASANQWVEIESYVEGIDTTCLCLACRGQACILGWWDELVGVDVAGQILALGLSVPSVVEGSHAQREAEEVVTRLVSLFPTADILLLVSFRITMEGNPYIVEVHADLGGDLIADTLLPAANPDFHFFELAVRVATHTILEVERVSFKPTALYYRGAIASPESSRGGFPEYVIYQQESAKHNLALLPETASSQGLAIRIWPLHLQWLNRNQM
jgi:phosphoribosylaminoimidazole carboxylase (NCAIR synthetase)